MSALRSLLEQGADGLIGSPPPVNCPFSMPTQEDALLRLLKLQQVPERLRALLEKVSAARAELNKTKEIQLRFQFNLNQSEISAKVEFSARVLDNELRREMKLSKNKLIEYEPDWRFSTTTLASERRRHAAKKKAEAKDHKPEDVGGPVKNWTDERPAHFRFAIATFEQALARTRAKQKPKRLAKKSVA